MVRKLLSVALLGLLAGGCVAAVEPAYPGYGYAPYYAPPAVVVGPPAVFVAPPPVVFGFGFHQRFHRW
jgi:hypothetical protein